MNILKVILQALTKKKSEKVVETELSDTQKLINNAYDQQVKNLLQSVEEIEDEEIVFLHPAIEDSAREALLMDFADLEATDCIDA